MKRKEIENLRHRLTALEERLGHQVRPRRYGMARPGVDQLEERVKHLSEYAVELRQVLDDLLRGLAEPPAPKKRQITN